MDTKKLFLAFLLFSLSQCLVAQTPATGFAISNTATTASDNLPWNISVNKNASGSNLIQWNATAEKNAIEFLVQRSDDGENFKAFKRIVLGDAKEIYEAEDKERQNKTYYRIIQINANNKWCYSTVASIQ